MIDLLKKYLIGIIIGIANIIPGVSSGTLAVITGVYQPLINAFSLDFRFIKDNWFFLLCIMIGILTGIVGFSFVISFLLENYYSITIYLFLGLIIGGLPFLFKDASLQVDYKNKYLKYIVFLISIIAVMFLGLINPIDSSTSITTLSFYNFFIIVFCCAIAAFASILPGISGSLLLMLFGLYSTVVDSIKSFDIIMLIPIVIGMIIGIIGGAILIKMLLKKFPKLVYFSVIGMIIGSIIIIFPGIGNGIMILYDILALFFGIALSILSTKLNSNHNSETIKKLEYKSK